MSKQKKEPTELDLVNKHKPEESLKDKPTVKIVHLHAGVDLVGSQTSFTARNGDLYEKPHGILMVSKKTGRKIVIPFANIKGYELL